MGNISPRPERPGWVDGPLAVVFLVALAARLWPVVRSAGGLRGDYGYDPSVYYTAAAEMISGRVPYRGDFLLLHPPGIIVVLAPFAAVGRLTGDSTGFLTASIAFTVIGAVNATLVADIARRTGLRPSSVLAAGLLYALWIPSVLSEYLPRLEPLNNLLYLIALAAVVRVLDGIPARGAELLAGAAMAASMSVKIWTAAPLLVVLIYLAIIGRRSAALRVGGSAVISVVAINGVFFALSPVGMFEMVVRDQLGRPRDLSTSVRLAELTGLRWLVPAASGLTLAGLVAMICAALVVLSALTWATRPLMRIFVVCLAIQLLVLALSPSYYPWYGDFVAPAGALIVAAGIDRLAEPCCVGARLPRMLVAVVAAAAATVSVVGVGELNVGIVNFPGPELGAAAAGRRCITADRPMALIRMDVLSSDLRYGCRVFVDLLGFSYHTDRGHSGTPAAEVANTAYQRELVSYLQSGQAFVMVRSSPAGGMSATTRQKLSHNPLLLRVGTIVLFGRAKSP